MGKCIHFRLSNHRVSNVMVVMIGLYIGSTFSYPESFHSFLVKCVQATKFSTFVRITPPMISVNIILLSISTMGLSKSHFIHFPPDINVVEQVWNRNKKIVKERIGWDVIDTRVREIVAEEWRAEDCSFIRELPVSMPRRLAAVIL